MKKIFTYILILTFSLLLSIQAFAEEKLINIQPAQFAIDQKDLGKTTIITISNSTDEILNFDITEGVVKRQEGKLIPVDKAPITPKIEIYSQAISIEPKTEYELKVRIKLNAKADENFYPAVKLQLKNQETTGLGIGQEFYIPYIIQDLKGEFKLQNNVSIGESSLIFNPLIGVTGNIQNTGTKYFKPSGSIIISKNGIKLFEQEITTQIEGYLFPSEEMPYTINWNIPQDDLLNSIGQYDIEVRVKSDISETTNISKAQITYVPITFILIAIGSLFGLIILAFILKKLIIKKK